MRFDDKVCQVNEDATLLHEVVGASNTSVLTRAIEMFDSNTRLFAAEHLRANAIAFITTEDKEQS
jgi:hypothetical protein